MPIDGEDTNPIAPTPKWWWWARAITVCGIGGGALGAMAQSTGFAMSIPWAHRIASHFATASTFSSGGGESWTFWTPIRAWAWNEEGRGLFEAYGGWEVFCPWLFLTDWLWLIPIGLGLAMLQSVCFPSQSRGQRVGVVLLATALASAGWALYALTFIWGTMYPIALAQREIGWIFALATILIGSASWIVSIPIARMMLRQCVVGVGNPHAIALFRGLWLADGREAPRVKHAPETASD